MTIRLCVKCKYGSEYVMHRSCRHARRARGRGPCPAVHRGWSGAAVERRMLSCHMCRVLRLVTTRIEVRIGDTAVYVKAYFAATVPCAMCT